MRRVLVIAMAVLAGGCSIFGDDDEPIEPPAELQKFDATHQVGRAWRKGLGGGTESLLLGLRPAVSGGRIYAGTAKGVVWAADAFKGDTVWESKTELALSAGPGVGEGLVVFGTSGGTVIALDAADGSERWKVTLAGEVVAAPIPARDLVIVRAVDGRVRALDAADGSERWFIERPVPRLTLRGNSVPAVSGDTVVIGFDDGRVGAYDRRSGDPLWENLVASGRGANQLERLADVDASPVIVGQDLYVASFHGRVAGMALESGQFLWASEISSFRDIAVDWTSVYVTDENSEVVAFNRASGAELWRQDALRARSVTGPAVFGNSLVVGDFEGYLHFLDPLTGAFQARTKTGGAAIVNPPVVAGELVYVQTEDNDVLAYAIRPRGGE
jgi:outer membrane protein assembly factor BamB